MYKNIAISLLGAWVLRDVFGTTEVREQIAIVMGLAAMLFIFLLFCEDQVEKWQKYSQRVRDLEENLERLRGGGNGERRESTGNIADAGADTDATA
jgi:hypothetical protein